MKVEKKVLLQHVSLDPIVGKNNNISDKQEPASVKTHNKSAFKCSVTNEE